MAAAAGGSGGATIAVAVATITAATAIRRGGRRQGRGRLLKPVSYILQLIVRVLILTIS